MRAADGSVRWIHDTSTPVFRDDGSSITSSAS